MTSETTTCPSEAPLTLGDLVDRGAAYLVRHGVPPDEAPTQAEILVEEAVGLRRPALLLRRADRPAPEAVARLREAFRRVAAGEPLQYVVGHWPFLGAELRVAPGALIPRPETEGLVERVLRHPLWPAARHAADIGTGTGAIANAYGAHDGPVSPAVVLLNLQLASHENGEPIHPLALSVDIIALFAAACSSLETGKHGCEIVLGNSGKKSGLFQHRNIIFHKILLICCKRHGNVAISILSFALKSKTP